MNDVKTQATDESNPAAENSYDKLTGYLAEIMGVEKSDLLLKAVLEIKFFFTKVQGTSIPIDGIYNFICMYCESTIYKTVMTYPFQNEAHKINYCKKIIENKFAAIGRNVSFVTGVSCDQEEKPFRIRLRNYNLDDVEEYTSIKIPNDLMDYLETAVYKNIKPQDLTQQSMVVSMLAWLTKGHYYKKVDFYM